MKLKDTQTKRTFVNLTPLIDVVFILLIFFMLASNFSEWQFIELGIGETDEMRVDSRSTSTIKLKPEGIYELNDAEMDVTKIIATVRERCRINISHPVIIQPYEGVALQSLVSLLDEINKFADKNVSLAKAGS
jgi:biopolymer transport protein ExbD